MSLMGPLEAATSITPTVVSPIPPSDWASTDDVANLYALNDRVRKLMFKWNSNAAKRASQEQLDTVKNSVSKWMHSVATVRRTTTEFNRPDKGSARSLISAGARFEKEFRLSLAWLAPRTYAAEFAPQVWRRFKSNPFTFVFEIPRTLMEITTAVLGITWAATRYVFWESKLSPAAMVVRGGVAGVQVAGQVVEGVAKIGTQLIDTGSFLTRNLKLIALVGLALYAAPFVMGKIGSAKRSYGGGS